MTILVIGGTGTIGSGVVGELVKRGGEVRALVRSPDEAKLPQGVEPVKGDLLDVESVRAAMKGASTLFLLNAVVPDELTQALIALGVAREAGIERIVYFSVIHSDVYTDVPHFTSKFSVERMIEQAGLAATVLRPAYFMQNDRAQKAALTGEGVYRQPLGSAGVAMADARDIAEVAALHLLKRERAADPLPREVLDVVGPDDLTGPSIAEAWSQALGRPIRYGGDDDLDSFERATASQSPSWAAFDMRQMMRRAQTDGMRPAPGDRERLVELLGRPLRSYADFARETAESWKAAGEAS